MIGVASDFHLFNNSITRSFDERMFLHLAINSGFETACALASHFGWECQRTIEAIQDHMRESASYHPDERQSMR